MDILDTIDTADELIEIIQMIYEERNDKKMWELYLCVYPNMTKETYVSFEEFKKPKPSKPKKTKEEILNDVRLIMDSVIEEGGDLK